MERLKNIKNSLISCVESQMGDLRNADAQELGEVIDMVKDMEEAIYYCTITKAMEENKEESKYRKHYEEYIPREVYYPSEWERDMDKRFRRMYFTDSSQPTHSSYPSEFRDVREGRSPISRKMYMESKEMHKGTPQQMKELEKYIQELSQDIVEMIKDATPEEKVMLQQKLSTLATKIQ